MRDFKVRLANRAITNGSPEMETFSGVKTLRVSQNTRCHTCILMEELRHAILAYNAVLGILFERHNLLRCATNLQSSRLRGCGRRLSGRDGHAGRLVPYPRYIRSHLSNRSSLSRYFEANSLVRARLPRYFPRQRGWSLSNKNC
jgi:hypothetical protein